MRTSTAVEPRLRVNVVHPCHYDRAVFLGGLAFQIRVGGLFDRRSPQLAFCAQDRMPADRVAAVSGQLILVSDVGSAVQSDAAL